METIKNACFGGERTLFGDIIIDGHVKALNYSVIRLGDETINLSA